MARADLTNFANLERWMTAVAETLKQTVLFNSHDDGAGGASDSPVFRLKPTQVVVYELLTVTRHTASDANEGAAASHNLIRGATVDLSGDTELLTTLSGSTGSLHADANMLALTDSAPVGESGVGLQYDSSGGTITGDNVMPGIWHILIPLDSFGDAPAVVIEAHTHEDNTQGDTLGHQALSTEVVSFSGSASAGGWVTFLLENYAIWPMTHHSTLSAVINGHDTDGGSADFPRFGYRVFTTGDYDVDYRYINP